MLGWILVLVLLLIVYFARVWYMTPRWRRAINMLTIASNQDAAGTQAWYVNPDINSAPFFLQFSNFEGDNRGKVTVAMYNADGSVIDAGFKDWEGVDDELRVGDFSILLKGRTFTYLSRKDLQNPWRATVEAKQLPKKAVVVPK
jgi:hypothetical protein